MFALFLSSIATRLLYLALHLETGSFPRPLNAREEADAFAAYHAGDAAARDKIIRHNLRLVAHIAKKYYAAPGEQEDLISIGTIGLIKAVEFSTYAARCIENEMRMHLRHIRRSPSALSMQEPIEAARDGSALTVMDVIPDDFALDEHFEQQDEGRRLRRLVDTLTARERQVILLRYGLGGQPPLTQQQAAALLGISRSYVSRIEKRALELLRRQVDQS